MTPVLLAGLAVVGLAYLVVAVLHPRVALIVLVVLDVAGLNGVIADQVGISPYRPQLALAGLVLLVMARRRQLRWGWSPVLLGVLVLYAGFAVSLIGADAPAVSAALLAERSRDLLYLLVVYGLLASTGAARPLVSGTVLLLAGLAGLTVLHEFVLHNQGDLFGLSRVPLAKEGGAFTARHAGTSSDVNFWARLLILFAPLALSLWASTRDRRARWLWGGCVAALAVGIYLTQSRGGFIALFAALVVWMLLAGRRYRLALLAVGVGLAVIVPFSGIASRLGTATTADQSVYTRRRLQLDALAMVLDRPLNGHGIGSYIPIFDRYDRLSDNTQGVDIVVAAHNLYLEQAADGGAVLLLAWAIFIGSILFCALRTRSIALRVGDRSAAFLALGVVAGVLGWLAASVFLHLSDFRALLVVAVVAAVLDLRARTGPRPAAPRPAVSAPPRLLVRIGVAAVALVAAAGLGGLVLFSSAHYRNTATLAVLPAGNSTAYQLDVISRGLILPTLAEALEASLSQAALEQQVGRAAPGPVTVSLQASRLGGGLVMTVEAPDAASAADFGDAAADLAVSTVSRLDPHYVARGSMAGPYAVPSPLRWLALPLAMPVVWAGVVWFRWGLGSRRRARGALPTGEVVPVTTPA